MGLNLLIAISLLSTLLVATLTSPFQTEAGMDNYLTLCDAATGQQVGLGTAISRFDRARLVLIGERHDNQIHHRAQLAVIRAMTGYGRPVTVGMEMFHQGEQSVLDGWIEGRFTEDKFRTHFEANWGHGWTLYRDILIYCRDNSLPVIALNVMPGLVSKVAKQGLNALTAEERVELPTVQCDPATDYRIYLRDVHQALHGNRAKFEHFCQAQMIWDGAMAENARNYLVQHPNRSMILLAGSVHASGYGIPARLKVLAPELKRVVILPEAPSWIETSTPLNMVCDFIVEPGHISP